MSYQVIDYLWIFFEISYSTLPRILLADSMTIYSWTTASPSQAKPPLKSPKENYPVNFTATKLPTNDSPLDNYPPIARHEFPPRRVGVGILSSDNCSWLIPPWHTNHKPTDIFPHETPSRTVSLRAIALNSFKNKQFLNCHWNGLELSRFEYVRQLSKASISTGDPE